MNHPPSPPPRSHRRKRAARCRRHSVNNTFAVRDHHPFEGLLFPEGATARAAAERPHEIPSGHRSPFAYYLYKLRGYSISHSRDHNGRHRLPFSCGSPLSNSLRLTPLPSGHADWKMHAQVVAHCVERSIAPALSGAEGRGLCWQACPVLKPSPPPSSGRTASSWTRTRAVASPTASSAASFPPSRGWKATASAG